MPNNYTNHAARLLVAFAFCVGVFILAAVAREIFNLLLSLAGATWQLSLPVAAAAAATLTVYMELTRRANEARGRQL